MTGAGGYVIAAIIGIAIALIWQYWSQLKFAYEHRDLAASASRLAADAQDFVGQIQKI